MVDTVSKKKRSEIMSAVRSKNTKIEINFRKELWRRGYRFRKHYNKLIGKPDIAMVKNKIAIFIDSCFWHGCPHHCRMPHSNRAYWNTKIKRNKRRDREVVKWYKKNHWNIFRFWEHEINNDMSECVQKIKNSLRLKLK